MAWTSPRTWVAGELVTAALMNAHVRDNLIALKDPPTEFDPGVGVSDYSTTSSSMVDISADLSVTMTTTGGDILCLLAGTWGNSSTGDFQLDFLEDAVSLSSHSDGAARLLKSGTALASAFYVSESPSAASHTYKPQWKISSGTGRLFNGGSINVNPAFLVREVS